MIKPLSWHLFIAERTGALSENKRGRISREIVFEVICRSSSACVHDWQGFLYFYVDIFVKM